MQLNTAKYSAPTRSLLQKQKLYAPDIYLNTPRFNTLVLLMNVHTKSTFHTYHLKQNEARLSQSSNHYKSLDSILINRKIKLFN